MRLILWLALVLGSSWSLSSHKADALSLLSNNPDTIRLGDKLYQKKCASCHGVKLEGQPNWKQPLPNGRLRAPPHDKTGHSWHHNDALLFKITKFGSAALAGGDYQTDMRGFKDELSDTEIIAVLSYIKSTWPQRIKRRRDQMNDSN